MDDMTTPEKSPMTFEAKDDRLVIPNEFVVKETDNLNIVSCGIAMTESDKRKRLEIVTDRYIRAGYIREDDPRIVDGVYVDHYETGSIPIVAKIGPEVVASLRLISNTATSRLPINMEEGIEIYSDWKEKISEAPFELSQLAKSMKYFTDRRSTFGLLRLFVAYARSLGKGDACGVIDNRVKELMNGPFMNFNLPQVGPSVRYMGSESTPIYINIDDCIRNAAKAGHVDLAEFLDTGKAPGFEWYVGK